MATFERHVEVDWSGSVTEGKGEVEAGSGAFSLPVTFAARIGEPAGHTSPEELVAAAHAACFAMALTGAGLFITHYLILPADQEGRWIATYERYFDDAWKDGVRIALSLLFLFHVYQRIHPNS